MTTDTEIMELKALENYTDRELLELILSNQVRSEQRLYKIYAFMSEKYGTDFKKNNQHKAESFKELLSSFEDLSIDINQELSKD